jgi:hypothetical protein
MHSTRLEEFIIGEGHMRTSWGGNLENRLESTPVSAAGPTASRKVSRKLVAVILVAVLLGTSGFYIWYEYYRHWSIEDLEDAAITWEYSGMNSAGIDVGFKAYLEGRTVTVEGKVSDIYSLMTAAGELNLVYLEGGTFASLMQWGHSDLEEGDRIQMRVEFERGVINGEEHVFSPQVGFPGYGRFVASQVTVHALNWVQGEWVLSTQDDGDDIVVRVERTRDPVPLAMARCNIRQGVSTGVLEYLDLAVFYRDNPDLDTITDLRTSVGLNDTLEFLDENDDGYLDDGDAIVIHGVIRPESASGAQTYLLSVWRDTYPDETEPDAVPNVFCAYLVITQRGLLWTTGSGSAVGSSFISGSEEGLTATIDYISEPAAWNDTSLLVIHGSEYARCSPEAESLSLGPDSSWSSEVLEVEDLQVECEITDVEGDGLVGVGDVVRVKSMNGTGLEEGETLSLHVEVVSTGGALLREVYICGATPVSDCLTSFTADSSTITLAPIHNGTDHDYELLDVLWDDVVVCLSDGENETEWALDSDTLDGGTAGLWTSAESGLGNLSVACAVSDLQGNGLANTGDRIEVAVTTDGGFEPGVSYTISIHHTPTDSDIFTTTFTG